MNLNKTLTLDELIVCLNEMRANYGNVPAFIQDADTGWELPIEIIEMGYGGLVLGGTYGAMPTYKAPESAEESDGERRDKDND